MIPLRLVHRHLGEHWLRSTLTVASMALAAFLLCLLRTVPVSMEAAVNASASDRLFVQSAVSLFVTLPEAYQSKIDAVDGVDANSKMTWFGGEYQGDESFGQFGVDADVFFDNYTEAEFTEGSLEEFKANRASCVVGDKFVEDYPELTVGSKIPLEGRLYVRTDGTPWVFTIAAIYKATAANMDGRTMYFHHDYVRESMEAGDAMGVDGTSVYTLKVKDGHEPERVQADIDDLFAQSDQRVQTTTESAFQAQFVTMMGNIPTLVTAIGGGVMFAILLAVVNTMLMAARERTRELGVLKAVGFTDRSMALLLVCESLLLCGLGGSLGVAAAFGAFGGTPPDVLRAVIPTFQLTTGTMSLCLGGALAIGLIAAAIPAWQVSRLRPVQAFREDG